MRAVEAPPAPPNEGVLPEFDSLTPVPGNRRPSGSTCGVVRPTADDVAGHVTLRAQATADGGVAAPKSFATSAALPQVARLCL